MNTHRVREALPYVVEPGRGAEFKVATAASVLVMAVALCAGLPPLHGILICAILVFPFSFLFGYWHRGFLWMFGRIAPSVVSLEEGLLRARFFGRESCTPLHECRWHVGTTRECDNFAWSRKQRVIVIEVPWLRFGRWKRTRRIGCGFTPEMFEAWKTALSSSHPPAEEGTGQDAG